MLALDPFYEMYPTTYRRSYPPWRYSWGGWGADSPVVPGLRVLFENFRNFDNQSVNDFNTGGGFDTYQEARDEYLRRLGAIRTVGGTVSLFRVRADGSLAFIAFFTSSSPSTRFPKDAIAPSGTPENPPTTDPTVGLSPGAKIATGVLVLGTVVAAIGLGIRLSARR